MRKQLIDFYLDWVNNYLTVSKMANDYNLSESDTLCLIDMGRTMHEKNIEFLKALKEL